MRETEVDGVTLDMRNGRLQEAKPTLKSTGVQVVVRHFILTLLSLNVMVGWCFFIHSIPRIIGEEQVSKMRKTVVSSW